MKNKAARLAEIAALELVIVSIPDGTGNLHEKAFATELDPDAIRYEMDRILNRLQQTLERKRAAAGVEELE